MAVKNYGEELGWELDVDFPSWGNTEIYVKTISKGYLLPGEKPKDAYWRVASKVAQRLNKPQMATKFFDYIWKGWLNLATPVFQIQELIEDYLYLVLVLMLPILFLILEIKTWS
jgi:hypothetical protein